MRNSAAVLFLGIVKAILAGDCPSCTPQDPHYFKKKESLAKCVFEDGERGTLDWAITLPNDHIWSGKQHARTLESFVLAEEPCQNMTGFEAEPVDEYGTVSVAFTTPDVCGWKHIERDLWATMAAQDIVRCSKLALPRSRPRGREGDPW